MKLFVVGQEATGVIAIGQRATGVIAIGQLATGVVAIGQLARGVVAIGQGALGVVVFGQVAVGLAWGAGLVAVAPITPGWLRTPPLLARWRLGDLVHGRWSRIERVRRVGGRRVAALLGAVAAIGLVIGVTLVPLADELLRPGGVLRDAPATLVPGSR